MGSHPLVAALLSALIPGAGQLYARRPLRALTVFLPTVVLAFGGYEFVSRGSVGMAVLLVQPSFLSGMLIVNVLILGWRAAAVIDAYLVTESSRDRSWMPIVLTLLLLGVAVPHVVGWSYGTKTLRARATVFVPASAGRAGVPLGTPQSLLEDTLPDPAIDIEPIEQEPRSVGNLIFKPGVGDPDAIAALGNILAPPTPGGPFLPFAEHFDLERLTILLVGADAGPGREGLRTDTMIVATFDIASGEAALFSLPRNFKLVPLPANL
ncbi:MAG: hypothetical protein DRJ28_03755, partial [Actinobacteria bacterium]